MLEARLLVGLGAGNMALCNAYVSQATTLDVSLSLRPTFSSYDSFFQERTQAMAMLAATGVRFFVLVFFFLRVALQADIRRALDLLSAR